MLTEKCRNQEAMIEEFELREQEYQEVMSETEMLRSQTESMKYVIVCLLCALKNYKATCIYQKL
jgi:hypothetical protein